jgi:type I restriction enzyme, S subunit
LIYSTDCQGRNQSDRLEARYQTARAQIDKLTPALLDKAFQGELVPQDPIDEPAATLLAKIQSNSTPAKATKTHKK